MQARPDQPLHGPAASALADLAAAMEDGVAIFDADGLLVMVNNAFRALNPALGEFTRPGTRWDMFLHAARHRGVIPLEIGRQLERIEADLLDQPAEARRIETRLGGQPCRLSLAALADGGFVLVQKPVPDSAAEAEAAREAETVLRKVLEACPACLTMSRIGDGQIIYRTPAATAMLGTAKSSFAHFADRAERADFVTALLPDARVDDMRFTGLRPDGSAFPASISARLIDYRDEDVIVSIIDDLSDELAMTAELAQQREQIFQAEKLSALGEMLAGVAHELNNPLSIIAGNAEILREELAGTSQAKRVGRLGNAAERCVKIVRAFLSMAREEPLKLKSVPVARVLDGAAEALRPVLRETGVVLLRELPADLPSVTGDEVQLTQVLINLVTNAAHAIRDAGTGDRVTVAAAAGEGTLCIRVIDNGPGVPDAIRGRVFDPLFTTKSDGGGTGVGLAYCQRVVSAHKGRILLEQGNGRGAVFSVTLPAAEG